MFDKSNSVSAKVEEVGDLVMGRQEALDLAWRLEPFHLPLTSSGRLVRVLGPVVGTFMLPVSDTRHDLPLCRAVAG
jgi:hypothetical protein